MESYILEDLYKSKGIIERKLHVLYNEYSVVAQKISNYQYKNDEVQKLKEIEEIIYRWHSDLFVVSGAIIRSQYA